MKRFHKFVKTSLVSLGLCAFALMGCTTRSSDTWGDKSITKSINTALHSSRGYNYPDVKVDSQRGVVYLAGAVDYDEQKARAEKVARSVNGVHKVVNHIAVRQAPTGRPPMVTPEMP